MNVQALRQTSVTRVLFVTTLQDLMYAVALVDIRVMAKVAQVDICFFCFLKCFGKATPNI